MNARSLHWKYSYQPAIPAHKLTLAQIFRIILTNRGIDNQQLATEFLKPPQPSDYLKNKPLIAQDKLKHVKQIIKQLPVGSQVLIYGDYDADGVTATAIITQTLKHLGLRPVPFVPDRKKQGYGMKKSSLEPLLNKYPDIKLVITVDQGIVAYQAADFLKQRQIPLIVSDHHQLGDQNLPADAIIHTTETSGSGIAWIMAQSLLDQSEIVQQLLQLATIGTVADIIPLTGFNRSLTHWGLSVINQQPLVGLQALMQVSNFFQAELDTYHIGYILGPRINAAGRITHASTALDLLLSDDLEQALKLADQLEEINLRRRTMTQQAFELAQQLINPAEQILFIHHPEFDEGIIGLVAGKLQEHYQKPAIVAAINQEHYKASCRSLEGFNMFEFLGQFRPLFSSFGGHAMAAGFSLPKDKLSDFSQQLKLAVKQADIKLPTPTLPVDVEITFSHIDHGLYRSLQKLKPFGFGNPKPTFVTRRLKVISYQLLGKEKQHLKLVLQDQQMKVIKAIAFRRAEQWKQMGQPRQLDIAYNIEINNYHQQAQLELVLKDFRSS